MIYSIVLNLKFFHFEGIWIIESSDYKVFYYQGSTVNLERHPRVNYLTPQPPMIVKSP